MILTARTRDNKRINIQCKDVNEVMSNMLLIQENGVDTKEGHVSPHSINAYICKELIKNKNHFKTK